MLFGEKKNEGAAVDAATVGGGGVLGHVDGRNSSATHRIEFAPPTAWNTNSPQVLANRRSVF